MTTSSKLVHCVLSNGGVSRTSIFGSDGPGGAVPGSAVQWQCSANALPGNGNGSAVAVAGSSSAVPGSGSAVPGSGSAMPDTPPIGGLEGSIQGNQKFQNVFQPPPYENWSFFLRE